MEAFIQLYGGQMLTIVGTLLGTWAGYRLRASVASMYDSQEERGCAFLGA